MHDVCVSELTGNWCAGLLLMASSVTDVSDWLCGQLIHALLDDAYDRHQDQCIFYEMKFVNFGVILMLIWVLVLIRSHWVLLQCK